MFTLYLLFWFGVDVVCISFYHLSRCCFVVWVGGSWRGRVWFVLERVGGLFGRSGAQAENEWFFRSTAS